MAIINCRMITARKRVYLLKPMHISSNNYLFLHSHQLIPISSISRTHFLPPHVQSPQCLHLRHIESRWSLYLTELVFLNDLKGQIGTEKMRCAEHRDTENHKRIFFPSGLIPCSILSFAFLACSSTSFCFSNMRLWIFPIKAEALSNIEESLFLSCEGIEQNKQK